MTSKLPPDAPPPGRYLASNEMGDLLRNAQYYAEAGQRKQSSPVANLLARFGRRPRGMSTGAKVGLGLGAGGLAAGGGAAALSQMDGYLGDVVGDFMGGLGPFGQRSTGGDPHPPAPSIPAKTPSGSGRYDEREMSRAGDAPKPFFDYPRSQDFSVGQRTAPPLDLTGSDLFGPRAPAPPWDENRPPSKDWLPQVSTEPEDNDLNYSPMPDVPQRHADRTPLSREERQRNMTTLERLENDLIFWGRKLEENGRQIEDESRRREEQRKDLPGQLLEGSDGWDKWDLWRYTPRIPEVNWYPKGPTPVTRWGQ